ncbi:MAG TPA: hypothetical protein VLC49_09685 [Solirubrobacteraceae bacterium]|nr:hypothetical protein [Solirubrobacteraceae bacterium]
MRQFTRRRPSAAMVVAVIALVVAASGTAFAAGRLVSGDSLIKKHSLSGDRLRNDTVSSKQIKVSSLGEVPRAKTAGNADELGGHPASAYALGSSSVASSGLVTASGGQTVQMASFGPFTVSLTCNDDGGGTFDAEVDVVSTTSNSEVFGSQLTAGTSQQIADAGPDSQFFDSGGTLEDFVAPPNAYEVYVIDSIFMPGTTAPCAASLLAAKS